MTSVIVYGPKGCGKTRNAQALARAYGCESVVDDWLCGNAVSFNALHLTYDDPTQMKWRAPLPIMVPFGEALEKAYPEEVALDERFVSPETPPEGLVRELLTILAEECCEVGKRASKALRFGVDEVQDGQPLTNAERIALEVGDVLEVVAQLVDMGTLNLAAIEEGQDRKKSQLSKYLQFAA